MPFFMKPLYLTELRPHVNEFCTAAAIFTLEFAPKPSETVYAKSQSSFTNTTATTASHLPMKLTGTYDFGYFLQNFSIEQRQQNRVGGI